MVYYSAFRVLKEKEDKQIEKSFKLDDPPAKTGCCSFSPLKKP